MSSDTQFTALGPTQIGFQCHGANIRLGGHLFGTEMGVQARCGSALGADSTAVHGQTDTRDATGVIGAAHIGRNAFGVWGSSAEGFAGVFDGRVHVNGSLVVVNGTKSAAMRTADGSLRCLYAIESPDSWFEDFGFGRVENGYGRVELEETFASVIADEAYHVFLTQYDGNDGLYVTERETSGFVVRSAGSPDAQCEFSYRVTAKRMDAAGVRFEEAREPEGKTLPELPTGPPADTD
jgi:hypothetical protein